MRLNSKIGSWIRAAGCGLIMAVALHCERISHFATNATGVDTHESGRNSAATGSAAESGADACFTILHGLKEGRIAPQMQRVFNYQNSATRFLANGKIEWFIADAAPGELPLGTVYREGVVEFSPLRIRPSKDDPVATVLLVSCYLSILDRSPQQDRQLTVTFSARSESSSDEMRDHAFAGALETSEGNQCYQYFLRTGEIRTCRPLEPGEMER